MFDIRRNEKGHIFFSGRLDASKAVHASEFMSSVEESCILDFSELDYISSAGLSVLLGTQKRLNEAGHSLKLVNLKKHISDIFKIAGFDFIFDLE